MDEVEVQVVRAQVVQGLLKGGQGLFIPRVLNPNFGREEHRLPGETTAFHGLSHGPLVAVASCGVDEAVPRFQGREDALPAFCRIGDLKHPQPLLGHGNAVVEGKGSHVGTSFVVWFFFCLYDIKKAERCKILMLHS